MPVTEQVLLCSITLNFNNKELTFIQNTYKNQKNFPEHWLISHVVYKMKTYKNLSRDILSATGEEWNILLLSQ